MSNPGYLASFETDSVAQGIAIQADGEVADAADSLRAPEIKIPLDHLLDEQARFEGLSAQGHRGTAQLYLAHTESELANLDAQLNYDMFRDAALPAETAALRFAVIDAETDFHLSDQTLEMMRKNPTAAQKREGAASTAPLQEAGVHMGARVTAASSDVTHARKAVRGAHTGLKKNLLEVKKDLLAQKRDAAAEEADDYERKIARVGMALDCVAMVFGATSAANSVVDVITTPGQTGTMKDVGAMADVLGVGTSAVKFGADLLMGGRLDAIKTEIASHQAFVTEIAGLQERLTLKSNFDAYQLALDAYVDASTNLERAAEERRQQYAMAGRLADDRLVGTAEEGQASQAMLLGSAAEETKVLLAAATTEHGAAAISVAEAETKAKARQGDWWYRDGGSFYAAATEYAKRNLGGGPDVVALQQIASVLSSWKRNADQARPYLDAVTAELEASLLHPAGAGGKHDDRDVEVAPGALY